MSTILIACERETEEQALTQALSDHGYHVLKSRDGIEALEIARNESPHLVLSNVSLPKMDGFALFRKCKQDEKLQALPFIFYTSRRSDPKYERFALELGAKRFIQGTTKPELVLNAVNEVLATLEEQSAARGAAAAEASNAPPEAPRIEDTLPLIPQLSERLHELESLQGQFTDAARFRHLFEQCPAAAWLVDKSNQRMLAVNEAALTLYGYTHAEFMAITADQLLGGEATAFGATSLIAYRHKDGRALSLLTTSKDIEFEGRPAELVAAHDVTYRVRAEKKIVDDAQRLRSLFAALPDGFLLVDNDDRIVDTNESYLRMSGYGRDELLRMNAADLQVQAGDSSASAEAGRYSTVHRRKDGTEWKAEVSAADLDTSGNRRLLLIRPTAEPAPAILPTPVPSKLPPLAALLDSGELDDETTLLQQMAQQLAQAFESSAALIASVDEPAQTFRVIAGAALHDPAAAPSGKFQLPVEWSRALESAAASQIDIEPAAFHFPGAPEARHCLLAYSSPDAQHTWLFAVAGRATPYTEEAQRDFHAISRIFANAAFRKRAKAQVTGALKRAEIAVESMIDLLCRITDQHDPHTAGSSNRVAALAVAIARNMGLGGEQQHTIHIAARLHDIGNVMIPREILARPLAWGEYERALAQTHAELGANLLATVNLGGALVEVVRQHHERLNGSGYPRGLKEADILPEARILMVADVVEAMCSSRPHRKALGLQAALEEITTGRGTLYDTNVADTCIRLFKDGGFKWPE